MPTVFVTVPPEDAASLAEQLVEEQYAACVNRVPCRSTYRWNGEVHTDDEEILLIKTTDGEYEAATERIAELHPHDVPAVERFDAADVAADFADWLAGCVGQTA
ncbi:divalent-cation tolerance protein CutA [Halorientalis sp.]|uniref:divalent-cation tolerance protein CutA n=1 Tax=Halorientalis sp. TaxID=1931229 RepID=UPI002621737F|nr:divalent-cation tolerance protein CutA [Halorientalis sp.]